MDRTVAFTSLILLFAGVHFTSWGLAQSKQPGRELPPEALELLAQLPEQKLTPEAVLSLARQTSDTYRAIQALSVSLEAFGLRATSRFRPKLLAELTHNSDKKERQNPFEPQSLFVSSLRTGVVQAFPSGTTLDLSVSLNSTRFTLAPGLGPPEIENRETRAELLIRQSLLRNALGKADRLTLKAATLSTEAQTQQQRAETEQWAINLIGQFYSAWLSQNQARIAVEAKARRDQTLTVTKIRLGRGTAERPDLLEAQSSLLRAETRLRSALEDLSTRWKALAISLKLPEAVRAVDPKLIPLALDDRDQQAKTICESDAPSRSGAMGLAQAQAARAEVERRRAESEESPELDLKARLATNGVNRTLSDTITEMAGIDHPAWEIGIRFELPLGLREARGKLLEARVAGMRAEAEADLQRDRDKVERINTCAELVRRVVTRDIAQEVVRKQRERARLQAEYFRIGRSPLSDVTRAEDDASAAESELLNEEVQLRLAAWNALRLAGLIPEFVEELK